MRVFACEGVWLSVCGSVKKAFCGCSFPSAVPMVTEQPLATLTPTQGTTETLRCSVDTDNNAYDSVTYQWYKELQLFSESTDGVCTHHCMYHVTYMYVQAVHVLS